MALELRGLVGGLDCAMTASRRVFRLLALRALMSLRIRLPSRSCFVGLLLALADVGTDVGTDVGACGRAESGGT